MDISGMMGPDELPFPVTDDVRDRILDLMAALERDDDMMIDCYYDELVGSARDLPEDQDDWIRDYYVRGGWRR